MKEIYVGEFVVFDFYGNTKITNVENFKSPIMNERAVVSFKGTMEEAVEYVKSWDEKK